MFLLVEDTSALLTEGVSAVGVALFLLRNTFSLCFVIMPLESKYSNSNKLWWYTGLEELL
jgi:hypothetical protein